MLYDEQGRAYVERPIIPEEQHLMYIVKDYRRMYNEHGKMLAHIKNLQDACTRLAQHNYSLIRKNQEQRDVIKRCFKRMTNSGVKLLPFLERYKKQNRL